MSFTNWKFKKVDKSPCNLVEFIETNGDLEEELERYWVCVKEMKLLDSMKMYEINCWCIFNFIKKMV
jgi:hypothetical protein